MPETSPTTGRKNWHQVAESLGPRFAARAAASDATDSFVAENYADLRQERVFSAGVPAQLGGGDASHAELCDLLRVLGRHCPSTALALSMHMHQEGLAVWRWRKGQTQVESFLRRIAAEELVIATSGGSDWLPGSGRAERVPGGYRVSGRKVFASGIPAAGVFMTCAITENGSTEPTVIHFPLPLDQDGIKILDTWHTLGMRGTGSQDLVLENVFVPETAVGARREPGKWNALFHVLTGIALPLIYSVYVGVAEGARDIAIAAAKKKGKAPDDPHLPFLVGEMENELAVAQLAVASMIDLAAGAEAGPGTTNALCIRRTLAGNAAIRTVEKAMEVAGGAAFYRELGLERMFRDVQAARYHPLQEKVQLRMTGRLALGLDIDG
jgi:alkylation response protein AidB-like acyl-CoA dehydrogenase